jgi:hypothetical protein
MKKVLLVLSILLALVSMSFATTISNASLKGKYSFQLASAHLDGWYASVNCKDPQGNTYTVSAGGSNVSNQSIVGVMTFDGKGNVSGTYSQYGKFDQAASNATVAPSCTPGQSNNGYAVYDPPSSGTFAGTYSIQPTGLGAMVITVSGGDTPNFVLELAGTAAVRNTVYLTQYDPTTYKVDVAGSAILQ